MSRVRLQAACAATGLTPRGVQAMAARGEIPGAAKIGRVWTFDADKLTRWIRAREQATWQRAQDATSIGGVKHTGRASKLPGVTCGKAYAQAIGLQILAPRFDSGRGLQPNPLNAGLMARWHVLDALPRIRLKKIASARAALQRVSPQAQGQQNEGAES